ncbi:MAG: YhbY family RNA-binding protein [archaeon]|nr:YhbY family RNA-binding protein [archaeon]
MMEKEAKKELMRRALKDNHIVHVGKDGLKGSLYDEVKTQIKKNHLIKIKILENVEIKTNDIADTISKNTESIVVDVRGNVIILTDKRTWTSLIQKNSK